jgi:methionine-gamma-lyase
MSFATACAASPHRSADGPKLAPGTPLAPSIVPASTFILKDAATGAKLSTSASLASPSASAGAENPGYLYTRWANPTNREAAAAVERVELCGNDLDGKASSDAPPLPIGSRTMVLSSGMAAITTMFLALVKPGDHIVAPSAVYGGTFEFLTHHLRDRLGVEITFIPTRMDAADGGAKLYADAIRPNTKVVYCETPANPVMSLVDLRELCRLVRSKEEGEGEGSSVAAAGILVCVDGTFASPHNQRPLGLGCDVVLHSCTKYLGGHSDLTAGAIVAKTPDVAERIYDFVRLVGNSLSPHDSFLLCRGIKTLDVRMERHNSNALAVARALEGHSKVRVVYYPYLESHPQHALAKSQMPGGGSGMLSFEVEGGLAAGTTVIEAVKLINLAVSLGGVESLIEHPASMTHVMVPPEDRVAAGITDGLIRLSVGLEHPDDLVADLFQALELV